MPDHSEPTPIPVREVWPHEASNFTPWLAENLHLLSEQVEIELELLQAEAPLPGWGGRVDILAKVTQTEDYVVIENQMDESDNDHLAGLLNYASQSGSKILIWVAGSFVDWHRRTVDWLNENDGVRMYAVEIKAWRAGDEIRKGLKLAAGPEHRAEWRGYTYPVERRTYLDFFRPIVSELHKQEIADTNVARALNDQSFPSGFAGISYNVGFWHSIGGAPSLDVYLWIATPDKARNKEIFDALYGYRDAIENDLSGVGWARRDNERVCSVYFVNRGAITDGEEQLEKLREWVLDILPKLKTALQPRLKKVMRELGIEQN